MKTLDDFPDGVNVKGRLSIAHLFIAKKASRCGIYLLGFEDGYFYIGLSINVVARFSQHKQNHKDICTFSFIPISASALASEEKSLIFQAEQRGMKIRNVEHVSFPSGQTDLDAIISPAEQTLAVDEPARFPDEQFHIAASQSEDHRARFQRKFTKFSAHPWRGTVEDLAAIYIRSCIPAFRRTEYSFWALSCMPSTNSAPFPRLFCFNINSMETFVSGSLKAAATSPWAFANLSKAMLLEKYKSTAGVERALPGVEVGETQYRAAGQDVIMLRFESLQDAANALSDHAVAKACRVLNLRLMRKGGTMYARYHCFPLVDAILGR